MAEKVAELFAPDVRLHRETITDVFDVREIRSRPGNRIQGPLVVGRRIASIVPEFKYFCFHTKTIVLLEYPAEIEYRTPQSGVHRSSATRPFRSTA
jgi:hypothetical protein